MGDRVNVYLTILNAHTTEAEKLFEYEPDTSEKRLVNTIYTFEEVNYGELSCLEKIANSGIPYDSVWEKGDEYGEGTESCRFTSEGEAIVKTVYGSMQDVPLDALIPLLGDYAALVACIKGCHEETIVLPWENQEEYSKIYRTKKLINA